MPACSNSAINGVTRTVTVPVATGTVTPVGPVNQPRQLRRYKVDRSALIGALDPTRHLKRREQAIVLTFPTYRPRGFASAAEQAGADAILDMPFTIDTMNGAILCPLEVGHE